MLEMKQDFEHQLSVVNDNHQTSGNGSFFDKLKSKNQHKHYESVIVAMLMRKND